jgi:non-ribosomal peptide synthase protein (TIGR01720 family)
MSDINDPLGYYDWSRHLHACVKTGYFDEAASFWRDQVVRSHTAGRDLPRTTGALANQQTRVVVLEPDHFSSLLRKASKTRQGVPVLILAAFAKALSNWLGATEIPVRLIGHGREPIAGLNPLRVVGWCSGGYPLVLPAPAISPVEHIELIREAFTNIPDGGTSYAALAAYSDEADTAFTKPAAGLRMNYVGQFSSRIKSAGALIGLSNARPSRGDGVTPNLPLSDLLDMEVSIVEGRLYIAISSDSTVVRDADANQIEQDAVQYLQALSG